MDGGLIDDIPLFRNIHSNVFHHPAFAKHVRATKWHVRNPKLRPSQLASCCVVREHCHQRFNTSKTVAASELPPLQPRSLSGFVQAIFPRLRGCAQIFAATMRHGQLKSDCSVHRHQPDCAGWYLPSSSRFQIYGILPNLSNQNNKAFDIAITKSSPPANNPQTEIQVLQVREKRLPSVRNIHLSALSRARRTAIPGSGFRRNNDFGENSAW